MTRKRIALTSEQHRELYHTDGENFRKFEAVEDKLTSFGRKQHFFRKILKDTDGTFYKMDYSLGTNDQMTWEKCNSNNNLILEQVFQKTSVITFYE